MLDYDMNLIFHKNLMKIIFQISTMILETWIGIENCQIVIVFCVDRSLPKPNTHKTYNNWNKIFSNQSFTY
jgi:hypothetical protein